MIGIDPIFKTWIEGISDFDVTQSLKTMSGVNANTQGGNYNLSLLGAFNFLMGAIAQKIRQPANKTSIEFVMPRVIHTQSKELVREMIKYEKSIFAQKVLPIQTKELAKETIELMYKLFSKIVVHDNDGKLLIKSIKLNQDGMAIILDFGARGKNWNGKEYCLAEALNYESKRSLDLDYPEDLSIGEVVTYLHKFNVAANIKDKNFTDSGRIFPQNFGIEVYAIDKNTTCFKLKCHTKKAVRMNRRKNRPEF